MLNVEYFRIVFSFNNDLSLFNPSIWEKWKLSIFWQFCVLKLYKKRIHIHFNKISFEFLITFCFITVNLCDLNFRRISNWSYVLWIVLISHNILLFQLVDPPSVARTLYDNHRQNSSLHKFISSENLCNKSNFGAALSSATFNILNKLTAWVLSGFGSV